MRHALAVVMLAALAVPLAAQKPVVSRADQLPVHSYPVSMPASRLVRDDTAMRRLAGAVQRDLEADLRTYDIQDVTTRRNDFETLSSIALIDGRYDDALRLSDSVRALQEKPAERLLTGLMLRPEIAARRAAPGGAQAAFRAELARGLAAVPYDSVQAELKSRSGALSTLAPGFLYGIVESQYDPASRSGKISKDIALSLLDIHGALRDLYPYKNDAVRQLDALIDAHAKEKPDIWAARDVALTGRRGLTPVVVAISDVGVDLSLFPGRVWTNPRETPANGKDDDRDGFVDDVHGIGFDWDGRAVRGSLRPLAPYTPTDLKDGARYIKGFNDLQAHITSPESRAVQAKIASLAPAEVKPFLERLGFYGNYAHGTHVAGIASRGNPSVRLQVMRLEFPYEMIPPAPTQAWADGFASAMRRSVDYYRRTGVRVVNMSWGLSATDLQQMLEVNRVGASEEERKALAKSYFDTVWNAFRTAIAAAPNVLFVAAAGNSNNSNAFTQSIPASFDLPNVLTVGAVDQAGDQAAFTSFGKVDVYANGYAVESVLPGGELQKWSGTSMASPQATNLAAKLLATHPRLSAVEVKRLIVQGADERPVSGQTLRLLDPRRSLEMAASSIP